MTMILKFFKPEVGMIDGLEKIHFERGKTYVVPPDLGHSFILRGSAVEIVAEIDLRGRTTLVGTRIEIKDQLPVFPPTNNKNNFFKKIFRF